jgi:hypothetical protein
MADSELLPKLIERLLTLTEEGKIDWKETASEDDFQAVVGQYVVAVFRTRESEDWDNSFAVRVADRKGTLLEEAVGISGTAETGGILNGMLSQLFQKARRKALNVDEALTELLSSLDSL